MLRRFGTHLCALLAAALLFTACSGSDGEATLAVASLEDAAGATDDAPADATLTADEAALEFSACMRDTGLVFPDIGVDAEGNIQLRDAFQTAGVDPRSAEFQASMEICGEILADAGFGGGGGRAALNDNPEVQDALVEYSECIRDQGFDVGDLQLGGGPGAGASDGTPPADGETPQRGQGAGQGGFGDRTERFAAQLGLDPEDPEVQAALETCAPIIDNAFAGFGPGPGA